MARPSDPFLETLDGRRRRLLWDWRRKGGGGGGGDEGGAASMPDTTCWANNNCPGTPICPNGSFEGDSDET